MNRTLKLFRYSIPLLVVGSALVGCGKSSPQKPDAAQESEQAPVMAQESPKDDGQEAMREEAQRVREAALKAQETAKAARVPVWRDYEAIPPKYEGVARNPLLTRIPDDSFFVLASSGHFEWDRPDVRDFMSHVSAIALDALTQMKPNSNVERAFQALFKGSLKSLSPHKLQSLGFAGEQNAHFVFYFAKNTPVLSFYMRDAAKFRNVMESYFEQYEVKTQSLKGMPVAWTLIPLRGADEAPQLAVQWSVDRMTFALVSDEAHADVLLPDLLVAPPDGQNALHQLSAVKGRDGASVVGLFDVRKFKNDFAAFEGMAERLFGRTERTDKSCVKAFWQLAQPLQNIWFSVVPVSGGSVMGFDTSVSFRVAPQSPLQDILSYHAEKIDFPRASEAPLASAYLSFPMPGVIKFIHALQDMMKREPLKCSYFEGLNRLNDESFNDILSMKPIANANHHMGGMLYKGSAEKPEQFAWVYASPQAAQTAQILGLIASESVKKTLAEAENGAVQDQGESELYTDVTIPMLDSMNLSEDNLSKRIRDERLMVASEPEMLMALQKADYVPAASIFHVDVSERLMKTKDRDESRDYHVGADVAVSPEAIDVTFRYVIE